MNRIAIRLLTYLSVAVGALSAASWVLSWLWLAGYAWAFGLGMAVSEAVVLFVWYGVPSLVVFALVAMAVTRDD
jgi:hypothetical protein